MTTFIVGPDDRSLFKSKRSTWEFNDALNNARNGDTLLIQSGYQLNSDAANFDTNYVIDKSITISSESGQFVFDGGIIVTNGAKVTISNLSINRYSDELNCIQVREHSSLVANSISLINHANSGQNYPIVYVDGESTAKFDNLYVEKSNIKDGQHKFYVGNANLEINNGNLNCKVYLLKSSANLQNTTINYNDGNAIDIRQKSSLNLQNVNITGGVVAKRFPCLYSDNSIIDMSYSIINQPNYNSAVYLYNNSRLTDNGSIIDSLYLKDNSEAKLNGDRIREAVDITAQSSLSAVGLLIDGKNQSKVNLYADGESHIEADWIGFACETNPNIKIENNVQFNVPSLYILKFDSNTDDFVVDESNHYIVSKKLSPESIQYFNNNVKKSLPSLKESPNIENKNPVLMSEESVDVKKQGPTSPVKKTAMQQLDELIGLKKVKEQIKEFIALAILNKKREAKGLSSTSQTLHSLFLGNPGTGKTTVARIVGKLLYEKGVIAKDKLVETSRAELVASYIGQTAVKTKKVLESALGGVLFIDEAYTLAVGDDQDFGKEAINEILKFMEDNRSNIMIIFAGYTNDMEKFLETNPGLRSRIPNRFDFEDYTPDEMVQIGLFDFKKENYDVDAKAYAEVLKNNLSKSNDHSNGRWVRNLNESIIRKHAIRISKISSPSDSDLVNIDIEDLEAAKL